MISGEVWWEDGFKVYAMGDVLVVGEKFFNLGGALEKGDHLNSWDE